MNEKPQNNPAEIDLLYFFRPLGNLFKSIGNWLVFFFKKIQANKNTPIILLTSKSSSFDRIKGALAGCDTYLVKPINHSDFERIINDQFPQPKE